MRSRGSRELEGEEGGEAVVGMLCTTEEQIKREIIKKNKLLVISKDLVL